MLGHLMGFMGFHGGFWREKITSNGTACPLRVILGDFLGLCRANVGPCWAVLGLCWAHVGSFGVLSVASRNCYMGLILACQAMSGQCWANVGQCGPMLGFNLNGVIA